MTVVLTSQNAVEEEEEIEVACEQTERQSKWGHQAADKGCRSVSKPVNQNAANRI